MYKYMRYGQTVSRVLYLTIIHLGLQLPAASCDIPLGPVRAAPFKALTVLLRMGFTRRLCLHSPGELLPHRFGGMFLLHFPYSYLRRTLSVILALRSPDFPHAYARDRLVCPKHCIIIYSSTVNSITFICLLCLEEHQDMLHLFQAAV